MLAGLALRGALLAGMVGGVVVSSAEPVAWFGGSAALLVMAEARALLALIRGAGRKVALGAKPPAVNQDGVVEDLVGLLAVGKGNDCRG